MSIELARSDLPIPQQPEKESYHDQNEQTMDKNAFPVGHYTSHTSALQPTPNKSTSFLLSTVLAVMTVLVVVAAAVGGSIAVGRKHEINRLEKLLDDRCAINSTAISGDENPASSSAHSIASAMTSTSVVASTPTPTPYDPAKDTIRPSSNCSAMGSIYTSASTKAPFTIHCNTDYPDSDMLSVWVFTFADCMEACARYNAHQNTPRCYAVSYDLKNSFTEQSGLGDCWLKKSGNVAAKYSNVTDSGVFNFDS